jgi:hypothetical protein
VDGGAEVGADLGRYAQGHVVDGVAGLVGDDVPQGLVRSADAADVDGDPTLPVAGAVPAGHSPAGSAVFQRLAWAAETPAGGKGDPVLDYPLPGVGATLLGREVRR